MSEITIQINYANFDKSDALESHVRERLDHSIGRLTDRLTRVEVHLADESGVKKQTPNDKRCLLEARPRGLDPIAVEEHADDIFDAVSAASDTLKRALTRRFEKLDDA